MVFARADVISPLRAGDFAVLALLNLGQGIGRNQNG